MQAMMKWFGRKPEAAATIDSFSFDTSGWTYHGEREPNQMRVWETPEGDAVSLHFFGIAPNIPVVASMDELCAFYDGGVKALGAKVVECGLAHVAGCPSVRLIIRVPQRPHGMMYQGVFTVPFRDFSFVVKIQCQENGTTGVRECFLFEDRMQAGETPNISGSGDLFPGWDPDSAEYDQRFPKHPVSRLRRLLEHVVKTAAMDASVGSRARFRLPGDGR
jgi:hypothetical protein